MLWVESAAEIDSAAMARTGLGARSRWRDTGASPFGIALRGGAGVPFESWAFTPPYLPPGTSLPVAACSDDPRQPFLFVSPGNTRPDQWTDGRAGNRQRAAGFTDISALDLRLPGGSGPGAALMALRDAGLLSLSSGADPQLTLTLSRPRGLPARRLRLPDFRWLD